MATDPGLNKIQSWMQALIVNQGTCEEAIASERAQAEIPLADATRLVKPSATMTPLERLDVYREMYLLRLEEALEVDYPALARHLGPDGFTRFVARYADRYPSRTYTLNRLGDHVPEFVDAIDDIPKPEFCRELVRLELELTLIFDADETPCLTQAQIEAVPPDAWEHAVLKPIGPFKLLEYNYPVSQFVSWAMDDCPRPAIRKRKTWLVAYRHNYDVHRLDLTEPAYNLLTALASGKTLGESIQQVRAREAQLFEWFKEWMAEGLFQSVHVGQVSNLTAAP
jgi:hypothetical protein